MKLTTTARRELEGFIAHHNLTGSRYEEAPGGLTIELRPPAGYQWRGAPGGPLELFFDSGPLMSVIPMKRILADVEKHAELVYSF